MKKILLYAAAATAEGGRANGTIRASDGVIDLPLRLPPEMGGVDGAKATNPEQLFSCAWAASFSEAVDFAAKEHGRILQGYSVTAKVTLGQIENHGFFVTTEIEVNLPGLSEAEANDILTRAKALCLCTSVMTDTVQITITRRSPQ